MPSMIIKKSASGYAETADSLVAAIERRGLTVFARVDHAAGAREAGLELEDEEVVLFGNAMSGTPLMQSDQRVGIELPLRVLLWSDKDETLLGYKDPRELRGIYELAGHEAILEQMATLLGDLAAEATS